ncbi:MAG: hypothetical protein ACLQGV_03280 [Bryobacteraceae bacterium]
MADDDTNSSASTDGATGTFANTGGPVTAQAAVNEDTGAPAGGDPCDPTSGSDCNASAGGAVRHCQVCSITSQTTALSPANRTRLRIAVGEQVTLTVDNGPATWQLVSGDGSLGFGTPTTVLYTAGDRAGSATIEADGPGNSSCTITFTVVEPASLTMVQSSGTGIRHVKGRPSCGFKGQPYLHPDDVNFNCIQVREMNSTLSATGYFRRLDGTTHQPLGNNYSEWLAVGDCIDGQGSPVSCQDEIYSGSTRDPVQSGSITIPITWQFQVGGGDPKDMPAFQQTHSCDAAGTCTSNKGGLSMTTKLNDDDSSW